MELSLRTSDIASYGFLGFLVDSIDLLLSIDGQDFAVLLEQANYWQLLLAVLPQALL